MGPTFALKKCCCCGWRKTYFTTIARANICLPLRSDPDSERLWICNRCRLKNGRIDQHSARSEKGEVHPGWHSIARDTARKIRNMNPELHDTSPSGYAIFGDFQARLDSLCSRALIIQREDWQGFVMNFSELADDILRVDQRARIVCEQVEQAKILAACGADEQYCSVRQVVRQRTTEVVLPIKISGDGVQISGPGGSKVAFYVMAQMPLLHRPHLHQNIALLGCLIGRGETRRLTTNALQFVEKEIQISGGIETEIPTSQTAHFCHAVFRPILGGDMKFLSAATGVDEEHSCCPWCRYTRPNSIDAQITELTNSPWSRWQKRNLPGDPFCDAPRVCDTLHMTIRMTEWMLGLASRDAAKRRLKGRFESTMQRQGATVVHKEADSMWSLRGEVAVKILGSTHHFFHACREGQSLCVAKIWRLLHSLFSNPLLQQKFDPRDGTGAPTRWIGPEFMILPNTATLKARVRNDITRLGEACADWIRLENAPMLHFPHYLHFIMAHLTHQVGAYIELSRLSQQGAERCLGCFKEMWSHHTTHGTWSARDILDERRELVHCDSAAVMNCLSVAARMEAHLSIERRTQ